MATRRKLILVIRDLMKGRRPEDMPISAINAVSQAEEVLAAEYSGPMKVYRIETGATYHFAARSMLQAIEVAWEGFSGYDDLEAIEEGEFSIELLDESKWPKTYNDDDGDMEASFSELVARTKEPGVLICSEWP